MWIKQEANFLQICRTGGRLAHLVEVEGSDTRNIAIVWSGRKHGILPGVRGAVSTHRWCPVRGLESSPVISCTTPLPESSRNVGLFYGDWDNAHSSDSRDKDQLAVFQAAYSWAKA